MAEVRRAGLVLIEDVRTFLAQGTPFEVRYDLMRGRDDAQPRYQCTYVVTEDGETVEYMLVRYKPGPYGVQPREFNFWPGLFRHHREFGGGTDLRVSLVDWSVTTVPRDEDTAEGRHRA